MKQINTYINEKLVINKDSMKNMLTDDADYSWDARTFKKDDILFSNPNISQGHYAGKGGMPLFYKVTDTKKDKVKIAPIGYKIVSGDRTNGESIPDDSKIYKDFWLAIDNGGFIYYGGLFLYLWDGTPEKFYN